MKVFLKTCTPLVMRTAQKIPAQIIQKYFKEKREKRKEWHNWKKKMTFHQLHLTRVQIKKQLLPVTKKILALMQLQMMKVIPVWRLTRTVQMQ